MRRKDNAAIYFLLVEFMLSFCMNQLHSQDYQISFTGSGQMSTVDSVYVLNLSTGVSLTIYNDESLHLLGAVAVNERRPEDAGLLRIYPNPSKGTMWIEFDRQQTGNIHVMLFDVTGKMITQHNSNLLQNQNLFTVENLNSGQYLLNVVTPEAVYFGKIISSGHNTGVPDIRNSGSNISSSHGRIQKSTLEDIRQMAYTDGEQIFFKGMAGNYSRILTRIPTESQIVDFEFIDCIDTDNQHYTVVSYGDQTWMGENLKASHFPDGTAIPKVESNSEWSDLEPSNKAYCWYDNSNENKDLYGCIYTWAAAMNGAASSSAVPSGVQGVCPDGWHLPSDAEWKELELYLGMSQAEVDEENDYRGTDEGGKLKEIGNSHWSNPNTGATNTSGFSALPGGYRMNSGTFGGLNTDAFFWSTTDYSDTHSWSRSLYYDHAEVYRSKDLKEHGFSVRCIKDQ